MKIKIGEDYYIDLSDVNYFKVFRNENPNEKDIIKIYFKNKEHLSITCKRTETLELEQLWLKIVN